MTTGSGDSRTFGGGPLFGDPAAGRPRGPAEDSRTDTGRTDATMTGRAESTMTGQPGAAAGARTTTVVPDGAAARRPMTVGTAAAARKRGRRARLTVKRIDPWSTLKFSFVYSIAGMVVLLVAVIVLYGVVDAMGVISSLRTFLGDVSNNGSGPGLSVWLSFDRVMLVTLLVGLINVVLFTAFATLTAFIYNVCTDIVGGVEVTLAERG